MRNSYMGAAIKQKHTSTVSTAMFIKKVHEKFYESGLPKIGLEHLVSTLAGESSADT